MEEYFMKGDLIMVTSNFVKLLNEMVIEEDITKRKELFDKIIDDTMKGEQFKTELELPSFMMRRGA
jgi:hypothetical protein